MPLVNTTEVNEDTRGMYLSDLCSIDTQFLKTNQLILSSPLQSLATTLCCRLSSSRPRSPR
jgi:hypothetical protein